MEDLVNNLRKEASRNAAMQGDKINQTNRRRKTFRYRNHLLTEAANRLEEAEQTIKDISELPVIDGYKLVEAFGGNYVSPDDYVSASELQAIIDGKS